MASKMSGPEIFSAREASEGSCGRQWATPKAPSSFCTIRPWSTMPSSILDHEGSVSVQVPWCCIHSSPCSGNRKVPNWGRWVWRTRKTTQTCVGHCREWRRKWTAWPTFLGSVELADLANRCGNDPAMNEDMDGRVTKLGSTSHAFVYASNRQPKTKYLRKSARRQGSCFLPNTNPWRRGFLDTKNGNPLYPIHGDGIGTMNPTCREVQIPGVRRYYYIMFQMIYLGAPGNSWLEDYFYFGMSHFQWRFVSAGSVIKLQNFETCHGISPLGEDTGYSGATPVYAGEGTGCNSWANSHDKPN